MNWGCVCCLIQRWFISFLCEWQWTLPGGDRCTGDLWVVESTRICLSLFLHPCPLRPCPIFPPHWDKCAWWLVPPVCVCVFFFFFSVLCNALNTPSRMSGGCPCETWRISFCSCCCVISFIVRLLRCSGLETILASRHNRLEKAPVPRQPSLYPQGRACSDMSCLCGGQALLSRPFKGLEDVEAVWRRWLCCWKYCQHYAKWRHWGLTLVCCFVLCILTTHVKTVDDVLRFRLRFLYNVIMKQ